MFASISASTVTRFARTASAALVACIVAATASAEASRAPKDKLPSVVVRYGDLDISTEAGARALYARLGVAARRVCPDDGSRDLRRLEIIRACRQQAVSRAVNGLNSAALAAVHSKHVISG